ncbi:conserved hypothetical protein [Nitrosococcus halophilus Nc 4]|uniref:Uncharacterized protein n=1 Tax=Nitrosococcus halophilus (strain Nc4) TaxID=472759 RepID=D5C2F9_NITHN|nr:hypothetical protein [Nitrosococcus halophilus]ADE14818.1 conserved hypothetical protein [Nitrosococcus halophilus Nc 4]
MTKLVKSITRLWSGTQAITVAILLTTFSVPGLAQATGQEGNTAPQVVENVESLLDEAARYHGQTVTVAGKIKKSLASQTPRTFTLESGGFFNDEIVVVIPTSLIESGLTVETESEVAVTGTVYPINLEAIQRKYSKDLDIGTEVKLEIMDAFLIADHIERRKAASTTSDP